MIVPQPPEPFSPLVETLPAGSDLIRVFSGRPGRTPATFNPGSGRGGRSRFAFFGDPRVPVLYAAGTERAAVCETILHDVPLAGGRILREDLEGVVSARVSPVRDLRLASFRGPGLRRLGILPQQLTHTDARWYPRTVRWAQAAHDVGLDGAVWMSYRCNTDPAYVLFGDRVSAPELEVSDSYARVLSSGPDLAWLIDLCASMKVEVLLTT